MNRQRTVDELQNIQQLDKGTAAFGRQKKDKTLMTNMSST
jgi:hypothetical protein